MPGISTEDCRSLERKIHAEITRIIAQFIEELEEREVTTIAAEAPREPPAKTGRRRVAEDPGTAPGPAGSQHPHRPIKPIDTNRILHGTTRAVKADVADSLEDDMAKIFGRKRRKGSR